MKLRFSPTSPYVRKVTVMAHETRLAGRFELVATNVWDSASDIGADNPLGKVPALILDDATVLFDSPVICEYLDGLHDGAKLFPPPGPVRWAALRLQALADGALDASLLRLLESKRETALQSVAWSERQKAATGRTLDTLEREAAVLDGKLTIGVIAVGCLLGYLDFRFAGDNWRDGRPRLAAWYEGFAARDSMTATLPKDP